MDIPRKNCLLTHTTQKHTDVPDYTDPMQTQAHVLACALKSKRLYIFFLISVISFLFQQKSNMTKKGYKATALAGGLRVQSLHTKTKPMNATPADTGQANSIADELRGIR